MITFNNQEDFEAAVLRIIRDNVKLNVSCGQADYYSSDETLSIELESLDPDTGNNVTLGVGYATIFKGQ